MAYDILFSIILSVSFVGIILMVYLFYVGKEISNGVNRADELGIRVTNSRNRIKELQENQKKNSSEKNWFEKWYDDMDVEEYVETTSKCAKCPVGQKRLLTLSTTSPKNIKKEDNIRLMNGSD